MYYSYLDSPVGKIFIAGDEKGLKIVSFEKGKNVQKPEADWKQNDAFFKDARKQLKDYFKGRLRKFDLKLSPEGTDFQLKVLSALKEIPYGKTTSYGHIARRIGKPKASRAVGAANGRNPISIVIPCHRVIGANGDLTGFGGGLDVKDALLSLEQNN